jgi:hypothetical protein
MNHQGTIAVCALLLLACNMPAHPNDQAPPRAIASRPAPATASCLANSGNATYYQPGALTLIGQDSDLTVLPASIDSSQFYVTADQLMPQWGLFPYGAYGTAPVGAHAGWGRGRLTFIANFGRAATYQVWLRTSDSGPVNVTIDDTLVGTVAGDPTNHPGQYFWVKANPSNPYVASNGPHYIDLDVVYAGIFDAILFSADPSYNPNNQSLPATWHLPTVTTRSQRAYRAAPFATSAGRDMAWLVANTRLMHKYDEDVDDWTPSAQALTVHLTGAADQYVNNAFEIVAGPKGADVTLSMSALIGQHDTIPISAIDVRVAKSYPYRPGLYDHQYPARNIAKPLLRDDRGQKGPPITGNQGGFGGGTAFTRMAPFNNRLIWLTAQVPKGTPPGTYTGNLTITDSRHPCMYSTVPVQLDIQAIDLQPVEGAEGIFYIGHPPLNNELPDNVSVVTPNQYQTELRDMAMHGMNSITAYTGIKLAQSGLLPGAVFAKAGLKHTVVDIMFPSESAEGPAADVLQYAQSQGISEVVFWTVDEPYAGTRPNVSCPAQGLCPSPIPLPSFTTCSEPPSGPAPCCANTPIPACGWMSPCTWTIDLTLYYLCQRKWQRPLVHSTVTIQNDAAFDAIIGGSNDIDPVTQKPYPLVGAADRPIMLLYNYDPGYTSLVKQAGGVPYSYFIQEGIYSPIYFRAAGGIFNRRLGYQGKFNWVYRELAQGETDVFHSDLFSRSSVMTYPDSLHLPVTTRSWEAQRAAIDDVRYLQALQRAVAKARAELDAGQGKPGLNAAWNVASDFLKQNYDNAIVTTTRSPFVYYSLATDEQTLDDFRSGAVDKILQINAQL